MLLDAIEHDVICGSTCGLYNLKCYQLWLVHGCWSLVDSGYNYGPSYIYICIFAAIIRSNVKCMLDLWFLGWLEKFVTSRLVSGCLPHRKDTLVQFKPQ